MVTNQKEISVSGASAQTVNPTQIAAELVTTFHKMLRIFENGKKPAFATLDDASFLVGELLRLIDAKAFRGEKSSSLLDLHGILKPMLPRIREVVEAETTAILASIGIGMRFMKFQRVKVGKQEFLQYDDGWRTLWQPDRASRHPMGAVDVNVYYVVEPTDKYIRREDGKPAIKAVNVQRPLPLSTTEKYEAARTLVKNLDKVINSIEGIMSKQADARKREQDAREAREERAQQRRAQDRVERMQLRLAFNASWQPVEIATRNEKHPTPQKGDNRQRLELVELIRQGRHQRHLVYDRMMKVVKLAVQENWSTDYIIGKAEGMITLPQPFPQTRKQVSDMLLKLVEMVREIANSRGLPLEDLPTAVVYAIARGTLLKLENGTEVPVEADAEAELFAEMLNETTPETAVVEAKVQPVKRGRPLGSKNRPKDEIAKLAQAEGKKRATKTSARDKTRSDAAKTRTRQRRAAEKAADDEL